MKNSLILSALFLSFGVFAQSDTTASQPTPCNCCEGPYLDFDFWIGDWVVFDTTGTEVGTNLIRSKANHCILEENWVGGSGFIGSSYNYFDVQDSTWNQVWVDHTGGILKMKGGLQGKKMVMQTKPQKSEKDVLYFNRITWTPLEDGSVSQVWEVLKEADESLLQLAFHGIYRKRE